MTASSDLRIAISYPLVKEPKVPEFRCGFSSSFSNNSFVYLILLICLLMDNSFTSFTMLKVHKSVQSQAPLPGGHQWCHSVL